MYEYYNAKLSAERLKQVYEIAPPRVQQYLEAETNHVIERIQPGDIVVELGCGYGRILPALAKKTGLVIGIDTSLGSLLLARQELTHLPDCLLVCSDAANLGLRNTAFDCVVCIQNGISAFHVDKVALIEESTRVTRQGGRILFSTYSERFWDDRLEWFRLQAEAGLLGEIDYAQTGDGRIVCKDGFTATTVTPEDFRALTANLDADIDILEVDGSSVFCEITPR